MHCLKIDPAAGIIEVEVAGFWTLADVDAMANAVREAVAIVAASGQRHRILYDYSASSIQSQEVISALQDLVRTIETPALRTALFTDGRLARLQAGRIAAVRDSIRLFDDRARALDWLRDAPAPAVPTRRAAAVGQVSAS